MNAFWIPSNLDLDDLKDFLKSRNHRGAFYEKLLFIIHTITTAQHNAKLKSSQYVQLHAKTMMHYVGENQFSTVMGYLEKLEIVDVDPVYRFTSIPGEGVCKGYRLFPKYRTKYVRVPSYEFRSKEYYHFRKTAQSKTDLPEMELNENHLYLKKILERVELVDGEIPIDETLKADEFNFRGFAVRAIRDKDFYFSVGKKGGRVTNNVSNFPKELRKHLRLDGKPLVSVDISNCHPLLLTTLYKKESGEQENFKKIVESGRFYRVLTTHLKATYDSLPETKRKKENEKLENLKETFSQFLNMPVPRLVHCKNSLILEISHAFDEMFPKLANEIRRLKAKGSVAKKMQRLESDLIIGTVVGELRQLAVTALTIHDSILCFSEDVDRVSGIIKSCCQNLYGLNPNLKYSNLPKKLEDDEPCPPMTEADEKNLKNLLEGL